MRRIPSLVLLAVLAAPAAAQSLWEKDENLYRPHPDGQDGINQSLYADVRARPRDFKKHDLVTIHILERARSRVSANTTVSKETELEVNLDQFVRLRTGADDSGRLRIENAAGNQPGIDASAEYERSGKGQTDRRGELLEKVSAEVIQVLPNRTLVIEARKTRRINDETETLILTGVIRADDVDALNTISSEKIARMTLEYTGSGTVNDAQKAGWLARFFEWVYPF